MAEKEEEGFAVGKNWRVSREKTAAWDVVAVGPPRVNPSWRAHGMEEEEEEGSHRRASGRRPPMPPHSILGFPTGEEVPVGADEEEIVPNLPPPRRGTIDVP